MSTKSAALPIERAFLLKAWLVVAAIVLVAATVIALALSATEAAPGGRSREPGTSQVDGPEVGRTYPRSEPIVIDGVLCGQCR